MARRSGYLNNSSPEKMMKSKKICTEKKNKKRLAAKIPGAAGKVVFIYLTSTIPKHERCTKDAKRCTGQNEEDITGIDICKNKNTEKKTRALYFKR